LPKSCWQTRDATTIQKEALAKLLSKSSGTTIDLITVAEDSSMVAVTATIIDSILSLNVSRLVILTLKLRKHLVEDVSNPMIQASAMVTLKDGTLIPRLENVSAPIGQVVEGTRIGSTPTLTVCPFVENLPLTNQVKKNKNQM